MAVESMTKPEVKALEQGLESLRGEVKSIITITTPTQYAEAGSKLVAIRNYIKDVKFKLGPFVDILKRGYDEAKMEMQKYVNQAQELETVLSRPMEDYKRREREAAQAEERRLNEERRKKAEEEAAAKKKEDDRLAEKERKRREREIKEAQKSGDVGKREADKLRKEADERERLAKEQSEKDAAAAAANVQDVKVKPSVPAIAGLRARVNWKFRIVDASKLPRQYLMPNEVTIGRDVREQKEKASIPGVEVYTEDSI